MERNFIPVLEGKSVITKSYLKLHVYLGYAICNKLLTLFIHVTSYLPTNERTVYDKGLLQSGPTWFCSYFLTSPTWFCSYCLITTPIHTNCLMIASTHNCTCLISLFPILNNSQENFSSRFCKSKVKDKTIAFIGKQKKDHSECDPRLDSNILREVFKVHKWKKDGGYGIGKDFKDSFLRFYEWPISGNDEGD